MRNILVLLVLFSCLFLFSDCKDKNKPQIESIPKDEIASIVYLVIGEVSIIDEKGKPLSIESKKTRLYSNHTIRTFENSKVDILLYDGTIIRISQNTILNISNLLDTELAESNSRLKLTNGRIFIKTNKLTKDRNIKVISSNSVAGVRGTEFQVIDDGTESKILVGEGSVEGSNSSGESSYVIEPGQKLEVNEEEAELLEMSVEEKEDFQKESNSVASIVESGRLEIQNILEQFKEDKERILETIEIQKEKNKALIDEQKMKNQELMNETKEKTQNAKKDVQDKTKSDMDRIKSGSQNEMDRIKSGNNNL